MNGAQLPQDLVSNGNTANAAQAAINKKRKKDGLKPIITTESHGSE